MVDDIEEKKEYFSDEHEAFVLSWTRANEALKREKERLLEIPEIGKFLSEFGEFEDESGVFKVQLDVGFKNANRAELVFSKNQ